MNKRQYLQLLKNVNQPKEDISSENSILQELFVQQSEIEQMETGFSRDLAILRLAIIAEYDASSLYERLADLTSSEKIRKVLLDISREEKVHAGEFDYLLRELDKQYSSSKKEGENEAKELLS